MPFGVNVNTSKGAVKRCLGRECEYREKPRIINYGGQSVVVEGQCIRHTDGPQKNYYGFVHTTIKKGEIVYGDLLRVKSISWFSIVNVEIIVDEGEKKYTQKITIDEARENITFFSVVKQDPTIVTKIFNINSHYDSEYIALTNIKILSISSKLSVEYGILLRNHVALYDESYGKTPGCIVFDKYKDNLYNILINPRLRPDKMLIYKQLKNIFMVILLLCSLGIYHFDVKSENIFVKIEENGEFRLLLGDFGYVYIVGETKKLIGCGNIFNYPLICTQFENDNEIQKKLEKLNESDLYTQFYFDKFKDLYIRQNDFRKKKKVYFLPYLVPFYGFVTVLYNIEKPPKYLEYVFENWDISPFEEKSICYYLIIYYLTNFNLNEVDKSNIFKLIIDIENNSEHKESENIIISRFFAKLKTLKFLPKLDINKLNKIQLTKNGIVSYTLGGSRKKSKNKRQMNRKSSKAQKKSKKRRN